MKVMSKMGISTVASYTGAQAFEAIGLDRAQISQRVAQRQAQVLRSSPRIFMSAAGGFGHNAIDEAEALKIFRGEPQGGSGQFGCLAVDFAGLPPAQPARWQGAAPPFGADHEIRVAAGHQVSEHAITDGPAGQAVDGGFQVR